MNTNTVSITRATKREGTFRGVKYENLRNIRYAISYLCVKVLRFVAQDLQGNVYVSCCYRNPKVTHKSWSVYEAIGDTDSTFSLKRLLSVAILIYLKMREEKKSRNDVYEFYGEGKDRDETAQTCEVIQWCALDPRGNYGTSKHGMLRGDSRFKRVPNYLKIYEWSLN